MKIEGIQALSVLVLPQSLGCFRVDKLNFCCRNYSREETIQVWINTRKYGSHSKVELVDEGKI